MVKTLSPAQRDLHQQMCNQFKYENQRFFVNATLPGGGKTLQSLEFFNEEIYLKQRFGMVVAPKSVIPHWQAEVEEYFKDPEFSDKFTYFSYHEIRQMGADVKEVVENSSICIFDECHKAKDHTSQLTKRMAWIFKQMDQNMWLTGTPVTNSLLDLWPMCHLGDPEEFNSYYAFREKYTESKKVWIKDKDGNAKQKKVYFGGKNVEELSEKIRSKFFFKIPDDVVRADIPQARTQTIYVTSSVKPPNRGRDKLEAMVERMIDQGILGDSFHPEGSNVHKNRNRLAYDKITSLKDVVVPYVRTDGPMVLFYYYTETGKQLLSYLRSLKREGRKEGESEYYTYAALLNGDTEKKRQKSIKNFSEGKADFFVAQIQTVAGIDGLQKNCHQCCFLETSYSPTDVDQALARVVRKGQEVEPLCLFLTVKGSYDEVVVDIINEKRKLLEEIG